jgi:16S rRNA (guanine527-N7)-methyltransferase
MPPDQIATLLQPFLETSLSDVQLRSVEIYLDLLLKWNAKMNLTSIRDAEEIVTRHFGESFFAAHHLFPAGDSNETTIDIGSGAGFPGMPIKLWAPSMQMTLVESNHRKATFLREVIRALSLEPVSVLTERAENIAAKTDLVTMRAVENFERILPVASSLVKPGGQIAILVGAPQVKIASSISPEIKWQPPLLVPNSSNRVLLVGTRPITTTPEVFHMEHR